MAPGRFGWNGGSGTTAWIDPSRELTAVLLTSRMMLGATGDFDDFWRALAEGL
jgi:CubicO group peptidase (beta-lactamase class C family)